MFFSVLMSVYGKEKPEHLTECLQSLVLQTLPANEVVLVEDGPISADLKAIIERFRKSLNIVSVPLDENIGLACALNTGLKYCSHDLIARMDSDDIAVSVRFEKQITQFNLTPQVDVLGSFAQEIDDGNNLGTVRFVPVSHSAIVDNLFSCPFIHPSVMYRKSFIESIAGYDKSLKRRQDYDLWFRCAINDAQFQNIPEVLLHYRFSENTHARQSRKVLWTQAMIGVRGVRSLKQPLWKAIGAFYPLLRSFLPNKLEHLSYKFFKRFDPRQRNAKP